MNVLEKYQEYAGESTDAPTVFHKFVGAGLVGTVMGRRLWLQHGHQVVFPNLWVCLVGPSTWVKKSTSISIAEYLLSQTNSDLLIPSKITTEKLYVNMSERPVGLMVFGELHILLSQFEREYNSELKSTLTDLYDSPAYRAYDTKGAGRIEVRYPAINILAGSTADWLLSAAKSRDICGGFYPRWLFCVAESSDKPDMPNPPARDRIKAEAIISELKTIAQVFPMERDPKGEMRLDSSAQEDMAILYGQYRKNYMADEIYGPFSGRALIAIRKLAMIHAWAAERRMTIKKADVEWGYQMAQTSMDSIANIVKYGLGDTKLDSYIGKYRKILQKTGKDGVTTREFYKLGPVRRYSYYQEIVKILVENGWAKIAPGKGRDGCRIVPLDLEGEIV